MKKKTKKPFLSAFARFKVNDIVQPRYGDRPLFQVKLRLMDIDTGDIIYMCVSKAGERDTFTQSSLVPGVENDATK